MIIYYISNYLSSDFLDNFLEIGNKDNLEALCDIFAVSYVRTSAQVSMIFQVSVF